MPAPRAPAVPLPADLDVVKKGSGPVLTTVDEFDNVGPGPSSSHTIGPMRITYDFYQRAARLSADKQDKATKLQVNLLRSLSATGKGQACHRVFPVGDPGLVQRLKRRVFLAGGRLNAIHVDPFIVAAAAAR